jgi:hypothetical protein
MIQSWNIENIEADSLKLLFTTNLPAKICKAHVHGPQLAAGF